MLLRERVGVSSLDTTRVDSVEYPNQRRKRPEMVKRTLVHSYLPTYVRKVKDHYSDSFHQGMLDFSFFPFKRLCNSSDDSSQGLATIHP